MSLKLRIPAIAALVLAGTLLLGTGPALPQGEPKLPDLYVSEDMIWGVVNGTPTWTALVGSLVTLYAEVYNLGPGNATSANVTFFIDGALAAVVAVEGDLTPGTDYIGMGYARWAWETAGLDAGHHAVRIEASDPAGDEDPTNNTAELDFRLADRPPRLQIQLDNATQQARVTESAAAMVTFTGRVWSEGDAFDRLTAYLTASVDTGWLSSMSPTTVVLSGNAPVSFACTVRVPQGSPSAVPGTLNVTARARGGDYNVTASALGTIEVLPYYGLTLECGEPYKEIAPGDEVQFSLKVWNVGNFADTVRLEITNRVLLRDDHYEAVLSASVLGPIEPNSYRTLKVSVKTPKEWTMWKSEPVLVEVKASSQGALDSSQIISHGLPLYVYEKGCYPWWNNYFTWSILTCVLVGAVTVALWHRRRKRRKREEALA